tara:strand:+ start:5953 stop:6432 length:480 start_codon:yes stop_codon:yes gene_type:complete
MVEDVLRIMNTKVEYSIINMPSRIKMIIETPPKLKKSMLTRLHESGYKLKVDVKERLLHVEIPKSKRKRKRVETVPSYTGKLDKCYAIGQGEEILRYLLGVHNICDFEVNVDTFGKEKHICCKNVECIDYAVIAEACKDVRVECDFPNTQWIFILDAVS